MKYVSPIYDVEVIATEDIMLSANQMANKLGIELSGNKTQISENVTINLTDKDGNSIGQDTTDPEAAGVSISMNFGGLFGN